MSDRASRSSHDKIAITDTRLLASLFPSTKNTKNISQTLSYLLCQEHQHFLKTHGHLSRVFFSLPFLMDWKFSLLFYWHLFKIQRKNGKVAGVAALSRPVRSHDSPVITVTQAALPPARHTPHLLLAMAGQDWDREMSGQAACALPWLGGGTVMA